MKISVLKEGKKQRARFLYQCIIEKCDIICLVIFLSRCQFTNLLQLGWTLQYHHLRLSIICLLYTLSNRLSQQSVLLMKKAFIDYNDTTSSTLLADQISAEMENVSQKRLCAKRIKKNWYAFKCRYVCGWKKLYGVVTVRFNGHKW